VTKWPPIEDAQLLSRLQMDNAEFEALAHKLGRRIEGRAFTQADYERAIAYPWERPVDSFWMEDGAVRLLGGEDRPAAGREQRYPLVTFGSNGSPGVLAAKLSVLGEDERDVLVLTGELHGYDVVPSAHIAVYGALPATIIPAPGVAVRAGLLMATAAQFEALTRTEFNYKVARIGGSPFRPDLDLPGPAAVLVYVSRQGSFSVDGEDVALAAVPANGRSIRALDQADLIDAAASLALGARASGSELVKRTIEDYSWAIETGIPALNEIARPFTPEDWELLPA
jgi:hypothetical protein